MYKLLFYICLPFLLFYFLVLFWILYFKYIKKIEYISGKFRKKVGHGFFLKKLFIDFPRQYAIDLLNRDPDFFPDFGFNLICGEQGSGKTITLVYLLLRYKKMYPKLKIKTNMGYIYEDSDITHWKDLVHSENGIFGEIDVIDEVQNWFNSSQSKDFPPEMLTEITQQRKQRKMIIGTTQVFTRAAKPIRENTYMFYQPFTVFGCLTVVFKYKPVLDDTGSLKEKKWRGFFWFVHSDEIRNSFDTYKKIEKYSEWQPRSCQLNNTNNYEILLDKR